MRGLERTTRERRCRLGDDAGEQIEFVGTAGTEASCGHLWEHLRERHWNGPPF
ncbi:MAG TPA: hypothetical protein VF984_06405 [Actinomycetota bacterium]